MRRRNLVRACGVLESLEALRLGNAARSAGYGRTRSAVHTRLRTRSRPGLYEPICWRFWAGRARAWRLWWRAVRAAAMSPRAIPSPLKRTSSTAATRFVEGAVAAVAQDPPVQPAWPGAPGAWRPVPRKRRWADPPRRLQLQDAAIVAAAEPKARARACGPDRGQAVGRPGRL